MICLKRKMNCDKALERVIKEKCETPENINELRSIDSHTREMIFYIQKMGWRGKRVHESHVTRHMSQS